MAFGNIAKLCPLMNSDATSYIHVTQRPFGGDNFLSCYAWSGIPLHEQESLASIVSWLESVLVLLMTSHDHGEGLIRSSVESLHPRSTGI